jgi:hypothetical protein
MYIHDWGFARRIKKVLWASRHPTAPREGGLFHCLIRHRIGQHPYYTTGGKSGSVDMQNMVDFLFSAVMNKRTMPDVAFICCKTRQFQWL